MPSIDPDFELEMEVRARARSCGFGLDTSAISENSKELFVMPVFVGLDFLRARRQNIVCGGIIVAPSNESVVFIVMAIEGSALL